MARAIIRSGKSIMVSLLTIKLYLPGCESLKEKRGLLQPLISKLRKEFNLSVSEVGLQDVWQSAWIGCAALSNDADHNSRVLNKAVELIEKEFPNLEITEHHIESH
jgi:uncharacterized protein